MKVNQSSKNYMVKWIPDILVYDCEYAWREIHYFTGPNGIFDNSIADDFDGGILNSILS